LTAAFLVSAEGGVQVQLLVG